MADFTFGNDEETLELRKLHAEVLADPDNFENWEKLVRATETLEGGLSRNSSPQSISAARHVYDKFLARYPLFFGYWKKYAETEFAIAGTESAEFIYERAIASVTASVDLWTHYCNFKVETCHDADLIRELFERAADSIGLDFLAHPFWDKYLEFEERLEQHDHVHIILSRIIHIPMHQYARYFERYRRLVRSKPLAEAVPTNILEQYTMESSRMIQARGGSQQDVEREIWAKIEQYYADYFHKIRAETDKRWIYEQEIKRPYFHVTELDDAQLVNWHKYLDFEESEGDFKRIVFLYERCLVAAAQYDDFWQRYARFMYSQEGKTEEVRNIYIRASCLYTAIAQSQIRLQWAMFEEACDRADVAAAIYDAIIVVMPDYPDAVVKLANLQLRQDGIESAVNIYKNYLTALESSGQTKGILVTEMAKLSYLTSGDAENGRNVFRHYQNSILDSESFWSGWLEYEINLPVDMDYHMKFLTNVKNVHSLVRQSSRLQSDQVRLLSHRYMQFLSDRGGKTAAKEYIDTDALVNGSLIVVSLMENKMSQSSEDGKNKIFHSSENGKKNGTNQFINGHS